MVFRFHFLRGDKIVTKMFSDSVYGGKLRQTRRAKIQPDALRRLPRESLSDLNKRAAIAPFF